MMTDCSSIHGASSTSSSDLNSRDCGPSSRIRIIKLVRPHSNNGRSTLIGHPTFTTFGFSIRGGREYGTGFFVSHVTKGSEADRKDLRVGDQIIRIGSGGNFYGCDDAVHRELSQFIMNQDRLTLKVRGVGIIPVKERPSDPLTWHVVPLTLSKSFDRIDDVVNGRDVRIVLNVAPRTKLGLGICKGPEWKPGIFVQFTKEPGVARESGLRPGDQILCCNGIDFNDILFSDAVQVMKSSTILELIVRNGIGTDLFPGESSGYNSSASSVTGDQSPCWGDQASKRLSIVREESAGSCDRMGTFRPLSRDRMDLDRRKEKLLAVETPRVPSSYNNSKNQSKNNTTIIKLSENGTVINNTLIPNQVTNQQREQDRKYQQIYQSPTNEDVTLFKENNKNNSKNSITNVVENKFQVNYNARDRKSPDVGGTEKEDNHNRKIANICFVSKQNETKVVTVEVHRSASTLAPPPPPFNDPENVTNVHERTPSITPSMTSSILSTETTDTSNSSSGQSSLSSAISAELKKRAEKKLRNQTIIEPPIKENSPKKFGMAGQNNDQHNALIDEFKKAHRKMFKNGFMENEQQSINHSDEHDKITSSPPKQQDNQLQERQLEREQKRAPPPPIRSNTENGKDVTDNKVQTTNGTTRKMKAAPPPPPLKVEKQMSLPVGLIDPSQPMTPAPDYDNNTPSNTLLRNNLANNTKGTMGRIAMAEMQKASGNAAELESIESFKLTDPVSNIIPTPPPLYFCPQKSAPPTMKKIQRPISVIVGEYGNNARKEPAKFDFISSQNDGMKNDKHEDMSMRLKNELEKTLSRSNLRKRNDSVEDLVSGSSNSSSNSNSIVQINNEFNSKTLLQKTNIDKLSSMLAMHHQKIKDSNNNINDNNNNCKTDKNLNSPLNGILKNGSNKSNSSSLSSHQTKNISFGDITK